MDPVEAAVVPGDNELLCSRIVAADDCGHIQMPHGCDHAYLEDEGAWNFLNGSIIMGL